jgi:hypothetical protein
MAYLLCFILLTVRGSIPDYEFQLWKQDLPRSFDGVGKPTIKVSHQLDEIALDSEPLLLPQGIMPQAEGAAFIANGGLNLTFGATVSIWAYLHTDEQASSLFALSYPNVRNEQVGSREDLWTKNTETILDLHIKQGGAMAITLRKGSQHTLSDPVTAESNSGYAHPGWNLLSFGIYSQPHLISMSSFSQI